ncbi:MAG: hypothetical protein ABJL57_11695 [Hyphomonas sp.]|uniref:hypothetical protein n=1 Tax=Hyphomonas sp. TaxID=87 RepID=UPI003264B0CA
MPDAVFELYRDGGGLQFDASIRIPILLRSGAITPTETRTGGPSKAIISLSPGEIIAYSCPDVAIINVYNPTSVEIAVAGTSDVFYYVFGYADPGPPTNPIFQVWTDDDPQVLIYDRRQKPLNIVAITNGSQSLSLPAGKYACIQQAVHMVDTRVSLPPPPADATNLIANITAEGCRIHPTSGAVDILGGLVEYKEYTGSFSAFQRSQWDGSSTNNGLTSKFFILKVDGY